MSIEELKQVRATYQQQYEGMCKQRSFADSLCSAYCKVFREQLPEQLDELALLCRQFLKFYDMSESLEKQILDILAEGRLIDDFLKYGNK